jgi:hypothetical protein
MGIADFNFSSLYTEISAPKPVFVKMGKSFLLLDFDIHLGHRVHV